jgi:hypothetical protein
VPLALPGFAYHDQTTPGLTKSVFPSSSDAARADVEVSSGNKTMATAALPLRVRR